MLRIIDLAQTVSTQYYYLLNNVHLPIISCHKSQFLTSSRKNAIFMRIRLAQRSTPSKRHSMFDFYTITVETFWWTCNNWELQHFKYIKNTSSYLISIPFILKLANKCQNWIFDAYFSTKFSTPMPAIFWIFILFHRVDLFPQLIWVKPYQISCSLLKFNWHSPHV